MTRRIPAAAVLLALLTALCVTPAMAAAAAELPVRITVSGDAPAVPETFTLTLRAASDNAPLPTGGRDGVYSCTVSGGGTVTLSIPADREGKHLYTLRQEPGRLSRGRYDDRTYHIAVTVAADGRCTATVYGDPALEGDKYDAIVFANRYRSRPAPEEPLHPSPKTGDGAVALYAALARGSMAGIAVLNGRKEQF